MARPDNMTTTTPVDVDRWRNCSCYVNPVACAKHGKWPNRHTPPDELVVAAELNAEHDRAEAAPQHTPPPIAMLAVLNQRNAELAATCRVLIELAQQLTNALGKIREDGALDNLELQDACDAYAALDAAAELGITPKP